MISRFRVPNCRSHLVLCRGPRQWDLTPPHSRNWLSLAAVRPLLHRLARRHHVYAVDLRGHGQSSHAQGAYTLQDYTRDVSALVVEQIGVSAVIYGHSLGALIGINMAAQKPEWVRALILETLLSTITTPPPPTPSGNLHLRISLGS